MKPEAGQLTRNAQQQEGSKGVKVGTRIAVIAEPDDDLSSLSLPAEASQPSQATSPQDETQSGIDPSKSSESQAESPPASKGEDAPSSISSESASAPASSKESSTAPSAKPSKQTYPLYPSIAQLLCEKGVPPSEVDQIPASGPKGRLLKGDVLAYLGTISKSYSSDQSSRITKLGHLDLSNVNAAPKAEAAPPPVESPPKSPVPEVEPDTEIAVTISLASVLEVQRRMQRTLRITLPLSTFIERAIEVANDDLPRSKSLKPSTDELFNQVLGFDKVSRKTSRGSFTPQITALPPMPMSAMTGVLKPAKAPDIIDLLTSKPLAVATKSLSNPPPGMMAGSAPGASTNVFSVSAPNGDEKRAKAFLERVKTMLQVEPGRLILK